MPIRVRSGGLLSPQVRAALYYARQRRLARIAASEASGLVADLRLKFNDGAFLTDDGADGLSATEVGTPTQDDNGKFGKCLIGTGSGTARVEYPNTNLKLADNKFVIAFWGRRSNQGSEARWIGSYDTTGNNRSWSISANASGALLFRYSSNGTTNLSLTGTTTLLADTWYHVAITRDDSGVIRMFLDGSLENSVDWSTNSFYDNGSTPIHVGAAIRTQMMNSNILIDDLLIQVGDREPPNDGYFTDDGFDVPTEEYA